MNLEKSAQEKYNELACYTLSHPDPSFIHQYVVDAFAAQKANKYTKIITLTFALIGLYLHIEKGYSGKEVQRAHMLLAKNSKQWPSFDLPEHRGAITVSDVINIPPGSDRDEMIHKWCASVWEVYNKSHKKVADLTQTELYKREKGFVSNERLD